MLEVTTCASKPVLTPALTSIAPLRSLVVPYKTRTSELAPRALIVARNETEVKSTSVALDAEMLGAKATIGTVRDADAEANNPDAGAEALTTHDPAPRTVTVPSVATLQTVAEPAGTTYETVAPEFVVAAMENDVTPTFWEPGSGRVSEPATAALTVVKD